MQTKIKKRKCEWGENELGVTAWLKCLDFNAKTIILEKKSIAPLYVLTDFSTSSCNDRWKVA